MKVCSVPGVALFLESGMFSFWNQDVPLSRALLFHPYLHSHAD